MKPITLFIISILFISTVNNANAQTPGLQAGKGGFLNDTTSKLTSFSAKYNAGKMYLKWTVANQHEDGLYLVYRSADGVDYENIGNKPGIGVPISKDIAYYFVDSTPVEGTLYYKIVHLGVNKTFLSSDKITACNDEKEYVSSK